MPRKKTISDEVLLAGCRRAFLAGGLGTSTREIAGQVGISEGVLFQRFGSKDALFFACMRLPQPDLSDALSRALKRRTVRPALVIIGIAALDYLRAQMPVLLLVLAHPKHRAGTWDAHSGEQLLGSARTIHDPVCQLLEKHADRGSVQRREIPGTVTLLISALLTRAMHEQLGVDSSDPEPWLRKLIATLARGFEAV